jgi:ring-1,2-phenylacetyl-CoA epoxidase subunit PaaC
MSGTAPQHSAAVHRYALRLGDDALILGHRLSEWCSRGPFLEEDLALSNVALDYIGRARLFYAYAAELAPAAGLAPCTEDDFAYRRDAREFTNALMYELPRGDFAFTMGRQFLVDAFNLAFLEKLQSSKDSQLAAIAAKAVKESQYHLRRSREWMLRLGLGTPESHERLQNAIHELWGYTDELFESDALVAELCAAGIAVDLAAVRSVWEPQVQDTLAEAGIQIPTENWQASGGREGRHTEWLGHLLCEMQFLQRAYPGLEW